jgi:transcriptional regulator with XRE-family HTH domain
MGKIASTLGGYLRQFRKQKGLSLQELAERSGISLSYLSRIERGERGRLPSLETLLQIGKGLGLTPEEFFQILTASVIECSIPPLKDIQISGNPVALLISISGHRQGKYPPEFEIIKEKLQNLCEKMGLQLSEPIITLEFTPQLEEDIKGNALLFDITGVFRGDLPGSSRHPITPAILCALQNRVPYFLLEKRRKQGFRVIGWVNNYNRYSEEFTKLELLFNSLECVLLQYRDEILQQYFQRKSLEMLKEMALLYDLPFSYYLGLRKLVEEGKLFPISLSEWERILRNSKLPSGSEL